MTVTQKLFTAEDRRQVTRAVADAELRTGAEIVPVIARASGRYDRPEDIVGLWTALVALAVAWYLLPTGQNERNAWGGLAPAWHLIGLLAAVVVGFIVGAVVGSRLGWLRRLFTPQQQMTDGVEHAPPTLDRVEPLPGRLLDRRVEQRQQRRRSRL